MAKVPGLLRHAAETGPSQHRIASDRDQGGLAATPRGVRFVDNRPRVDPADALATVHGELSVPLGVAWELLLRPERRSILFSSDRQDQIQLQHGRIAEGTVFTCYHGTSTVTTQTVLDLEPLHYLVTEDTTPIPGARMIGEVSLEPRGDATVITITSGTTPARGCRALSTTSSAAGC